jgi:alkanesulfonate monooxygenase SsuD/methylene tetrahydromethanopterin reductase-like flavin-dependent oxidoreductase (luciferase family)
MSEPRPDVLFGIFPMPDADGVERTVELAMAADRLGLDLVGIQDHPYQRRHLDAYALLTWIAARTDRIRLFADVSNLPLRPPAVLAKTAASIDVLSGGRFELGLGAGGFWDAIAAMGGPRRPPGEAVEAFEEAITVIRSVWSGERSVTVEGDHYRLQGLHPGPPPAHEMGIWVGANGPRMLGVIGARADGWVVSSPYAPPEQLGGSHRIIDRAAAEAGRDPGEIRRIYNVNGAVADAPGGDRWHGTAGQWVDLIEELVTDHRMDAFVFWPDHDLSDQVRRWAEVAAAARDRLGIS